MKKCIASWSGGKDSCFALVKAIQNGYEAVGLLNMMNENGQISRSHAIPGEVLERQAAVLELPIYKVPSTWGDYESKYIKELKDIKSENYYETVVFGDIDLEPHREWEEKVSAQADVVAYLPLWLKDRKELVYEMIDSGVEAIIVSCNTDLGIDFLGRKITRELVSELEARGVDACGENGEYHTLVVNAPIFKKKIDVSFGEKLVHGNYCFIEMF
ncbi:Dph6-related ATP pyrophosphatase [Aureibacter tunicatorum]|uniref:Uncharacterized protein (TIGR00290 family) n=1 Tax=Aureibacter tunicatorum TaxID=866807 RepID=A0AAE4BS13_9BACT|nr:diphthine--ammonia ligase [Aureibacter tunicatorum]MDR6240744.1 uncharacterized protein (TIGR00290 family) [Aureibacter tunicatorum]BDD06923.1 ATPase [Aureibacter tunicatorum]